MRLKTIQLGTRKTWYHGTDRLPQGGLEWCSYFGGKRGVADDFISQPGRGGRIKAVWIVPAHFKRPTRVLDVTEGKRGPFGERLVGAEWFQDLLKPYLPPLSGGEDQHFDYHYAEAFCRTRDELFPGVAGVYRGQQWGLIIVDPDSVMAYGRPFRAEGRRARKASWWWNP